MQTKVCTKCGEEKPATTEYFFKDKRGKYGIAARCKECCLAYQRAIYTSEKGRRRYLARKDKHYAAVQRWREANKTKVDAYNKKHRASEKAKATKAAYARGKRSQDTRHRLIENLRMRTNKAFTRYSRRRFSLTSYLQERYGDIFAHVEGQFYAGMAWDNYGEIWEVDHIIPLKSRVEGHLVFRPDSEEDILVASNKNNLRPLARSKNRSKRNNPPCWDDLPPELQAVCTPRIKALLQKVEIYA